MLHPSDLPLTVGALTAVAFVCLAFRSIAVSNLLEPKGLFLVLFTLAFLIRPIDVLLLGSALHPNDLSGVSGDTYALVYTLILCLVWGVFVFLGLGASAAGKITARAVPKLSSRLCNFPTTTHFVALWLLWAVAVIVLSLVWVNVPGIDSAIRYVRIEKGLGSLSPLTSLLAPILFYNAAVIVMAASEKRNTLLLLAVIGMAAIGSSVVFLLGSRNTVVLPLIATLGGLWWFGRGRKRRAALEKGQKSSSFARESVLYAVMLVPIALLSFLRIFRAGSVGRDVNVERADLGFLLTSMNLNLYDAFAGVVSKVHSGVTDFRLGEDIIMAFVGLMPRALWEQKPEVINSGVAVARLFNEERIMGLPISAVGEWYWNFGLSGVILGGFLSGIVLCAISQKYKEWYSSPVTFVFSLQLVLEVFKLGVANVFPRRLIFFALGLLLVAIAVTLARLLVGGRGGKRAGGMMLSSQPSFSNGSRNHGFAR